MKCQWRLDRHQLNTGYASAELAQIITYGPSRCLSGVRKAVVDFRSSASAKNLPSVYWDVDYDLPYCYDEKSSLCKRNLILFSILLWTNLVLRTLRVLHGTPVSVTPFKSEQCRKKIAAISCTLLVNSVP